MEFGIFPSRRWKPNWNKVIVELAETMSWTNIKNAREKGSALSNSQIFNRWQSYKNDK
jgi:hypothetical protein